MKYTSFSNCTPGIAMKNNLIANIFGIAFMASAFLLSPVNADGKILYGDRIYLQLFSQDNKWLTGGRGSRTGNHDVRTDNLFNEGNVYLWEVQSTPGDSSDMNFQDPQEGECVKYGDKIYLKVNHHTDRWLTGGRGGDDKNVYTRNVLNTNNGEAEKSSTYEWIVKSEAGVGLRSWASFDDPGYGECVSDRSLLYLQVNDVDYRWLSGGRNQSQNYKVVKTDNVNKNDDTRESDKYRFIVQKGYHSDGNRDDYLQCDLFAGEATGSWQRILYNNADSNVITYSVAIFEGQTRMEESSVTTSFSLAVEQEVEASYGGTDSTTTVSAEYAKSMGATVQETLQNYSQYEQEFELTFNGSGQFWQFQYDFPSTCEQGLTLKLDAVVLTDSGVYEPCCLPGHFKDPDNLYGPCEDGPDFCDR